MKRGLVMVRGGGDIATGSIWKLVQCGFDVLVLETKMPSAIRRRAAFSEAAYHGSAVVEGMRCCLAHDDAQARALLARDHLAMLIDERAEACARFAPAALVDAILAKRNLGTHRGMAPITVALGPGFTAGEDADAVIETMRGHRLGRVLYTGAATPNTGVPGVIAGHSADRVIHSPAAGRVREEVAIGQIVRAGDTLCVIESAEGEVRVKATIDGVLRGLIPTGYPAHAGLKIADIDPRIAERENCESISDKARCIAGGVVEAILHLQGSRA